MPGGWLGCGERRRVLAHAQLLGHLLGRGGLRQGHDAQGEGGRGKGEGEGREGGRKGEREGGRDGEEGESEEGREGEGESLFILSSQDNLGLETDCDWGVPLLNKPSDTQKRVVKGTYHDYDHPCMRKSEVRQHGISPTYDVVYLL